MNLIKQILHTARRELNGKKQVAVTTKVKSSVAVL